MAESEVQTRAAICGTGVLIAIIFLFAGVPPLLLIIPVAVLFLGLVAGPEETHAAWYGMLNSIGLFAITDLADEEKKDCAGKRHYFWFGEAGMAAILAGAFAVPLGVFLAGRAEITLAFTGAAMVFLPLFIFLPKLVQWAMKADTGAAIDAFGRNEHVRKVFWALFLSLAGLVLARVVDPATAQQVLGVLAGS